MPIEQPASPRHTTKKGKSFIEISLPNREVQFGASLYIAQVLLLIFGVASFAFSVMCVAGLFGVGPIYSSDIAAVVLSLFFFILITIVNGFLIYFPLQINKSREIICITGSSLIIRCEMRVGNRVLNVGRPKEYATEHIKELRVSSGSLRVSSGYWATTLAFDYGAATVRFAANIDEAEAKQILAEILEQFPTFLQCS